MNAAKQSNINPTNGEAEVNQIDNFAKFSKIIIYFLDFIILLDHNAQMD